MSQHVLYAQVCLLEILGDALRALGPETARDPHGLSLSMGKFGKLRTAVHYSVQEQLNNLR